MKTSKHIVFWSIAARNIQRFRGRTLAVLVPLLVVMACASAMTFIKDGMQRDALRSAAALPDLTVQRMLGGRVVQISEEVRADIAGYDNVRRVAPRIWGFVPLAAHGGSVSYTLMGIDPVAAASENDISSAIEEGRFLRRGERNCAVVGKAFAALNRVAPGDRLVISDEMGNKSRFTVVGVFGREVQIYSADLIVTDIESARSFFGYSPSGFTDLSVHLENPDYADQLAMEITSSHRNVRVLTRHAQSDILKRGYGDKAGVFQMMWLILLLTVMLLAWSQASSISLEMKKETGVLKALGWQTLDIIEVKMMEMIITGLTGILGGVLLGLAYVHAGAPVLKQYFLSWAVLYPDFPLPVQVEPGSLFLLVVTGLLPLCAATVFPAWLTGAIEPDSAIRSG